MFPFVIVFFAGMSIGFIAEALLCMTEDIEDWDYEDEEEDKQF